MNMSLYDLNKYWFVNDRYEIYKDTGVVYDTDRAQDIPQGIFALRDRLMTYNKGKRGQ
jgi:hypothetical protein